MSKIKKLLIALSLTTSIISMSAGVQAAPVSNTYSSKPTVERKYHKENISRVNKALLNATIVNQEQTAPMYNSYTYSYSTLDDLKEAAKKYYKNRDTNFSMRYTGDINDLNSSALDSILDYVVLGDDYLEYSIKRTDLECRGYDGDMTLNFTVQYLVSKEQEYMVDEKVDSILASIIKDYMTDDQKEKAIHDYIVSNVAYDETHQKYSAYDALFTGETVCQGYALLTYKMLNKVGIVNRIVAGKANNGEETESHGWNLVNLYGKWYHLDCTWDDPLPDEPNRVLYNYYNLTDSELAKDHYWKTSDYPRADTPYDMSSIDSPKVDINNSRQLQEKLDVPSNKEWRVKFTKAVDYSSVNNNTVLVVDEANNRVNVNIGLDKVNDTLILKPVSEYKSGKYYYVIVTTDVLSAYKEKIPKPVVLKFKVK